MLTLFSELNDAQRQTVLAFAEFLLAREGRATPTREPPAVAQPESIPRPQNESVVAALKRLSSTYGMLNKSKLLNETSGLVAQHVMEGRDAVEVIDELEIIFRRQYERYSRGEGGT